MTDDDLTFDGSTASGLTISADGISRILEVKASATVEVVQLTLSGGDASSEQTNTDMGGGILNKGILFVTTSTIRNSSADIGGGIYNDGGTVTITHSTITENTAATASFVFHGGGGVANDSGLVTIESSTLSNNEAGSSSVHRIGEFGGGVFNRGDLGTVMIINSTVSGNEAGDDGGGLYNHTGDKMVVISSTITHNTSASEGGGMDNFGLVEIQNTILAGNTALEDTEVNNCRSLYGSITSKGHSLIGPGCSFNSPTSTDLVLGEDTPIDSVLDRTLGANGGPTYTHALVIESPDFEGETLALEFENPAIDAGSCEGIGENMVDTDQRSLDRPANADDPCDIGAFEVNTESCLSKQEGDYDNGATWSCGFRPSNLDNVIVAPGHTVTTVDDEEVKNLKVVAGKGRERKGGGELKMGSKIINVHEDLIIDGKLDPGTSTVEMKGTEKQLISGEGTKQFYRLHISNVPSSPGDSADVETEGPVEVLEETRVKQGQFRPDDQSRFQELVIESQGIIKPKVEATIEVKGNLISESSTGLAHNESTIRFTGSEKQVVTGAVALKKMEVEKVTSNDNLKALELAPGTTVEGATRIMKGQLSPATATTFEGIAIEAEGRLQPASEATVEIRGNLSSATPIALAHNESTLRFTGAEQQTVTGGVTIKNLEVEKSTDLSRDLVLTPGTTVEGATKIMRGQLSPATATTFQEVAIESNGMLKPAHAATVLVKGDLRSTTAAGLAHNESTIRFTGAEQQTVTGGVTFKHLEVDKSLEPQTELILAERTKVEGETKIMRGQLSPASNTTFRKVAIEDDGTLKPASEATVEIEGDLIRRGDGNFANNDSTIRFTGAEQQTVEGGVTFKNLEVVKSLELSKDLVLLEGTKVEGETRVIAGQIAAANAIALTSVHILALASFRHKAGSAIEIQGDFLLENGGLYDPNQGSVTFNGDSGEQNAIFEGGTTTMNVNLINPDGLHARYAEGTAGTATLQICDSSVRLDSFDTGDEALVKCEFLSTDVVDGPIQVALADAELTVPDETSVTATPVEGGDFEIENSADSNGSLVASVDGVDLVISPGEAAETNAKGALGLLRGDVIGLDLQKGIQNSLVKKVDSALKKLAKNKIKTTMNKVNAFIHQVQALSGKKFSKESGDALVSAAQGVLILLNVS
ncbi:MAG: hypothetical protein JSU59_06870 [Nitrospirota bacterium]|nr:MAG: hypothetical protein JSU59_06870 [Nitrospirota bacterium]